MNFFPAEMDLDSGVVAMLDLCEIDSSDGKTHRFILGQDGEFTDTSGNVWVGSSLLTASSLQSAIDGVAPSGDVTLSYFQDPGAPDLASQMRELGVDYINGQEIRFYVQPILSQAEFQAPKHAPRQWLSRTMRRLTFRASGAQDRSISASFESWAENRKGARRITLNTEGHEKLIGEANPSLEFMPTSDFQEEKLFG